MQLHGVYRMGTFIIVFEKGVGTPFGFLAIANYD
jgi:hypothetical protein